MFETNTYAVLDVLEPDIEAVVSCLGASVDRIRALRARSGYTPEGGHRLMNEWAELRGPDPFQSPILTAYALAAAQLGAAEDHIAALELLLLDGSTSVAPYAVARAAIEATGRAALLLDPTISAPERAALAVAERVNELHELRRLMRAHDPLGVSVEIRSEIESVGRRIKALQKEARALGLAVPPKRPSFSHVFQNVLSLNGEDDALGRVTAAIHSAVSHAVPNVLIALTADEHEDPEGHPFKVGFVELDERAITELVLVVLVAYLPTVSRQIDAYGWPPSSWSRWRGHIRAVLRRALALLSAREVTPAG